jgi:hypothetical protein
LRRDAIKEKYRGVLSEPSKIRKELLENMINLHGYTSTKLAESELNQTIRK